MADERERMARAGNYVLGLMDDAERERAEHDLETDGAFRDAVVRMADRMHLFDGAARRPAGADWAHVAGAIAALPQMRAARIDRPERNAAEPRSAARAQAGQFRLSAAALLSAFALAFTAGLLAGLALSSLGLAP